MSATIPADHVSDAAGLRRALVEKLRREGNVRSRPVEEAFLTVPRHLFLPGVPLEAAYRDEVIFTKQQRGRSVSASSQPTVMAIMLEQLQVAPGHRVLEIGAGTGYNTALMAHIAGEAGRAVTVEIDDDLAASARQHLAAAGASDVEVVCGDGGFGYPPAAPYDRIIAAVSAWDVPPAWRQQLAPGGRLVLPLSIRGVHKSIAFEAVGDVLVSVSVRDCRFVMLRGVYAGPECDVSLGPGSGLYVSVDDRTLVDAHALYRLLGGPSVDRPTSIHATARECFGPLRLWLAMSESDFCQISAEGEPAEHHLVPDLFRLPGKFSNAGGLLGHGSICLLTHARDESPADAAAPFHVHVRAFGPDEGLADRLIEQVRAWDQARRPANERLRVRAYPREQPHVPAGYGYVIPKQWTSLVLGWV